MKFKATIMALALMSVGACAVTPEKRAEYQSQTYPYAINNVQFVVNTGADSHPAVAVAKHRINKLVALCKTMVTNPKSTDVIVTFDNYYFQPVHGIVVPGRSRLVGTAKYTALGAKAFQHRLRGRDKFQNDLTSAPTRDWKTFFSKAPADNRLGSTFADNFIQHMWNDCAKKLPTGMYGQQKIFAVSTGSPDSANIEAKSDRTSRSPTYNPSVHNKNHNSSGVMLQ